MFDQCLTKADSLLNAENIMCHNFLLSQFSETHRMQLLASNVTTNFKYYTYSKR